MKVIQFPTKGLVTTVELSYKKLGESSYQKLKDVRENEDRKILTQMVE